MDALKEVKEWLLFKFQPGPNKQQLDASAGKSCSALTPQTIPEFVIPGSGNSSRRTSSEFYGDLDLEFDRKRNSYGGRGCNESPPGSPVRMSMSGSAPCIQGVSGSKSRSAPVTPKRELLRNGSQKAAQSALALNFQDEGTNDDPHSMAAMSLPHFRVQTSFGFSTLTENPHTRRKESLFHLGSESLLPRRNRSKFARNSKLVAQRDGSTPDICLLSTPAMTSITAPSSSMPSVIVTAAQRSSCSRSPSPDMYSFSDQCHRRLSPTYRIHSTEGLHSLAGPSKYNRFYNRRRSSLQIAIQPCSNSGDSSSASGMSTPSSLGSMEQVNDRSRASLGNLHCQPLGSPTGKRHSAPNIPSDENMNDLPKPRSSSCQFITKEGVRRSQTHLFAPFGELKFSFQYLPASSQLKVTIIKAENLGGHQKQDRQLNTFARVYLMPGKLQKQNGTVVKKSRNPVYNQDFYFHNIDIDELRHMTLLVKIFSKPINSLKPNEFIGKATIELDNYDVTMENRIWKDLELSREKEPIWLTSRSNNVNTLDLMLSLQQEFGFLHFGLKYSRNEGILNIRVEEAKSLPLHPITGPPNPYVCIEVAQPGRHVTKQQTNTLKSCSNPRFMQTFSFDVAADFETMQNTSVTVAVFDHDRIRSDILIGQVVLGCLATEVSQYGHWQEMLENAGFMTTKWHYLVDRDD